MQNEIIVFYPASLAAWREWLAHNHLTQQSVWLVFYKKESKRPSITWSEAVDIALCFGWIDSKKIKVDHETSHQFFCKRKPNSTWSKINKQKVEHLIKTGQMTEAGYKAIQTAKQNNWWTMLDDVEELIVPSDLEYAFANQPNAGNFYSSLNKSTKKAILQWVVLARRSETRLRRIAEIVALAEQKRLPKIF